MELGTYRVVGYTHHHFNNGEAHWQAPHIVGRKEVTNFRPTTMDVLVPSAFSAPTSAAVDVVQQATRESQEL